MRKPIVMILLFFSHPFEVNSQIQTDYRVETFGSIASGENTPFWMLHHNWGMTPLNANNYYLRGGVFHQQTINKDWSFKAGIDLAGSSPHTYCNVWIQQLYGELNWKILRLNIGSKEDYISLLNPYLSSGDFCNSNNARPRPEIKISIPEFLLIPYTKDNLYIKMDFAVGYHTDGDWQESVARPHNFNYTKNVFNHHKSIYFKFGNIKKNNKLQFTFGLNHQALYGGTLYVWKYLQETGQYNYFVKKQPKGIGDLWRVVIAKEGSAAASYADQAYIAGSSIGAFLFKFDYKLKNKNVITVYKQHFFDDGSGMAFENYRDGLYGIEYKTKSKSLLSGAVFEYIYTKNQTGAIHFNLYMDKDHYHLRSKGNGNDNYYNNCDYVQGPSYYGRTQGTPLFLSPEYNKDGRLNFTSSRIIAFHLGIEGYLHPNLQYRLLATTGQTWGLYYVPFASIKEGVASQLDLIYSNPKMQDIILKLSSGFNRGKFFSDNSFGGGITITKRGKIL